MTHVISIVFQNSTTGSVDGDQANKPSTVNRPSFKERNDNKKRQSQESLQKYVTTQTAKKPASSNVSTGSILTTAAASSTDKRHTTPKQIPISALQQASEVYKFIIDCFADYFRFIIRNELNKNYKAPVRKLHLYRD